MGVGERRDIIMQDITTRGNGVRRFISRIPLHPHRKPVSVRRARELDHNKDSGFAAKNNQEGGANLSYLSFLKEAEILSRCAKM